MSRAPDLFTAADVARFCSVDLKTIHHWAARGKLRHHKTEGNHVRVHRVDLVAFLRAYDMPLPTALREGKPRVMLIDADASELTLLTRALQKRFAIEAHADAIDALVALGESPPQIVVAALPIAGVDLAHAVGRLRASERTGHVRVVTIADEESGPPLEEAGVAAVVARGKSLAGSVRETLEQLAGFGQRPSR